MEVVSLICYLVVVIFVSGAIASANPKSGWAVGGPTLFTFTIGVLAALASASKAGGWWPVQLIGVTISAGMVSGVVAIVALIGRAIGAQIARTPSASEGDSGAAP
jgi:hypothetical protein